MKKLFEEVLNKYYKVDGKNVTVELYYDTFSELIDKNFGDNSVERLNETLLDEIEKEFAVLPSKYNIKVFVRIKDYENYTVEQANAIVRENVCLKIISLHNINVKKSRISAMLALVGSGILVFSYFLLNEQIPQVITDVVNIAGTLLVWEAASQYLIERKSNQRHSFQYIKRLNEVVLTTQQKSEETD